MVYGALRVRELCSVATSPSSGLVFGAPGNHSFVIMTMWMETYTLKVCWRTCIVLGKTVSIPAFISWDFFEPSPCVSKPVKRGETGDNWSWLPFQITI